MAADRIALIKRVFSLDSGELARSLGVSPITISRWESGLNDPTGLQAEVLQGLYNMALDVERTRDEQRAQFARGLIVLGIGALIFYLLKQASEESRGR